MLALVTELVRNNFLKTILSRTKSFCACKKGQKNIPYMPYTKSKGKFKICSDKSVYSRFL